MSEIKRGGPFPGSKDQLEAQVVGPYPTWNSWKHLISERFGQNWLDGYLGGEELIHRFYVMRRLDQKSGHLDKEKAQAFWVKAKSIIPNFEGIYGDVIAFIVEKTPFKEKIR